MEKNYLLFVAISILFSFIFETSYSQNPDNLPYYNGTFFN